MVLLIPALILLINAPIAPREWRGCRLIGFQTQQMVVFRYMQQ